MRIVQVINSLATGGAENLLLESSPFFKERVVMDFLMLKNADYPFERQLREKYPSNCYYTKWKSVYNPLQIFSIFRKINKYDIVHVHLFPAFYWVVFAKLLRFSRVKVVLTEHSTSNRRMRSKFFKYIDQFVYKHIDCVITISDEVNNSIKSYLNFEDDKFLLIKNGVNINKISQAKPVAKLDLLAKEVEDVFIILQVSSFQHPKDQKTVIRALQELPEHVVAVFAGSGRDIELVKKFARELQLSHRVFFLGVRTDIPQLLKTADVVVLSSHYEGLSLASIEGMASGRPFIASDVPGLHGVVKDAGLLFPDKDEQALAAHIRSLMDDPEYYAKVVAACQERAAQYDIQVMVDKHMELYKSLIG